MKKRCKIRAKKYSDIQRYVFTFCLIKTVFHPIEVVCLTNSHKTTINGRDFNNHFINIFFHNKCTKNLRPRLPKQVLLITETCMFYLRYS